MPAHNKRSVIAWCLYDWANSAFPTVLITFVFGVYFSREIVGDEIRGSVLWSYALGASGICVAFLSPLVGALSDKLGQKKPGLLICTAICVCACMALWFCKPEASFIILCLLLISIANIGFELALVFYNAMLPDIVPARRMGTVSGWAWGFGYAGGIIALLLTLFAVIGFGGAEPFLPISEENAANVRASGPLIALWVTVFSLPLVLFIRDAAPRDVAIKQAACEALEQLKGSLQAIGQYKQLVRFLIASALYRDGLTTLFSLGGVYAAARHGLSMEALLIFAVALNVNAGLGAIFFSFWDDTKGSKITILIALVGLIISGVFVLLAPDQTAFMISACVLGLFIGPVQASSRTFAGRLSPKGMETQTYGFYAFTGKSVAFLGPLLYGVATSIFQSEQAGMMTILIFWITGFGVLMTVKDNFVSGSFEKEKS